MNPTTTYRVSAKAVIRNDQGDVLLIKEASGDWGLPGGGVEYGEDIVAGLERELQEECGIIKITSAKLLKALPYFASSQGLWWMWLVYEVTAELPEKFNGQLHTEFVDTATFKDSRVKAEKRILEALS